MTENIYTSDAEPGEVLITLTHPHGAGTRRATLHIVDSRSGERLVEVDLTPEQFMAVMSSSATRVTGAQLPVHPERIGKRSQNVSTNIRSHGEDIDAEAEKVRAAYLTDGWETVRIDRTNFGRRVVAYRWIDDDLPAATARVAEEG